MGRPQTIRLSDPATGASPAELVRRTVDIALACGLLIVLAPLLAVVALLVRVSSHGPVLHREPAAAAHDGRPVSLLTFRTQVDGGGTETHARLRAIVGAQHAYTPVGRQIARLRLDRLPRLFNVLRGDATLVG